jgi:uncharacterized protein (TIGR02145 family)
MKEKIDMEEIIIYMTDNIYGYFIDYRDIRKYEVIKIGNQIWMAENLAYKASSGCWAYNNESSNASKYGYLYDWETAKSVCPSGWHLPSDIEWSQLENHLGGRNVVGKKIKSRSDWANGGNGTNSSGFNALPGGYRCYHDGWFDYAGNSGDWWSSTPYESETAWARNLGYDYNKVYRYAGVRTDGYSVRCVLNNDTTIVYLYESNTNDSNIVHKDIVEEVEPKPLFYCEDFPDGSFPKKSCDNCDNKPFTSNKCTTKECTPTNAYENGFQNWQGELKGHPIYEGDKCWVVFMVEKYISCIIYASIPFKEDLVKVKYFSNKDNARTYYNKLKWKDKLKFKIGDVLDLDGLPLELTGIDWLYEVYNTKEGLTIHFNNNLELCTGYKFKVEDWAYFNKIGFKVGDKCWGIDPLKHSNFKRKYYGEIKSFFVNAQCELAAIFTNGNDIKLSKITNKVAVHCPTKEDFEFILNKLNYSNWHKDAYSQTWLDEKVSICINSEEWIHYNESEYLQLTLDEYMQNVGEAPLFITEDGKNIYTGMNSCAVNLKTAEYSYSCFRGTANYYKYFSTKQAAQDYLDSLEPEFEVGKWHELVGSPVYAYFEKNAELNYGFNHNEWTNTLIMVNPSMWKPANMDKVKELLITETKRRYKIGDRIKNNGLSKSCIENDVNRIDIDIDHNTVWLSRSTKHKYSICVFDNGIWAEIIEPKFTTADRVKKYEGDKYFQVIEKDKFHIDETEVGNFKYCSTYEYKFDKLENAQQYLAEQIALKRGIKIGTELFIFNMKTNNYEHLGKAISFEMRSGFNDNKCIIHFTNDNKLNRGVVIDNVLTLEELAKEEGLFKGLEINLELLRDYRVHCENTLNWQGLTNSTILQFLIEDGIPLIHTYSGHIIPLIGFKAFKKEWDVKRNKFTFNLDDIVKHKIIDNIFTVKYSYFNDELEKCWVTTKDLENKNFSSAELILVKNKETIEVEIPNGKKYDGITLSGNVPMQNEDVTLVTIHLKDKELSAEQKANKLGFKIGDKVWSVFSKKYLGEITKFQYSTALDSLMVYVSETTSYAIPNHATNKVAIHTSTKEKCAFVRDELNIRKLNPYYKYKEHTCLIVNEKEDYYGDIKFFKDNGYLILSVDEYMKSIDRK